MAGNKNNLNHEEWLLLLEQLEANSPNGESLSEEQVQKLEELWELVAETSNALDLYSKLDIKKGWDDLHKLALERELILYETSVKAKPRIYRTRRFWKQFTAIAAVLLLLFIWTSREENSPDVLQTVGNEIYVDTFLWSSSDTSLPQPPLFNDPKPAKSDAVLTLTDGYKVDIESLSKGKEFIRAGLKIKKMEGNNLSITFEDNKHKDLSSQMNTIKTPKGGLYSITLGDGTNVQMNTASTLKFPSRFIGNHRQVYLDGEAFFDVKHDPERQFIVSSGSGDSKQEIAVYGTKFNVMAYPEKEAYITTLLEGSVKVIAPAQGLETFLIPNEQSKVGSSIFERSKADSMANLAWKNNLFYFSNMPFEDVMLEISRWYNVKVIYKGPHPNSHIWAEMARDKTLTEVLGALAQANDVQFDVKGKEVFVKRKVS